MRPFLQIGERAAMKRAELLPAAPADRRDQLLVRQAQQLEQPRGGDGGMLDPGAQRGEQDAAGKAGWARAAIALSLGCLPLLWLAEAIVLAPAAAIAFRAARLSLRRPVTMLRRH